MHPNLAQSKKSKQHAARKQLKTPQEVKSHNNIHDATPSRPSHPTAESDGIQRTPEFRPEIPPRPLPNPVF